MIITQQTQRFETIGIDCVAMNVNDLICVGATPVAMVDYLAVERADPEMMRLVGIGLKRGAELAEIEIPGGELAELPDLIRGHPAPYGFDLAGASFGTVSLERIVTGREIEPGHALIGLPFAARLARYEKAVHCAAQLRRRAAHGRPPSSGIRRWLCRLPTPERRVSSAD